MLPFVLLSAGIIGAASGDSILPNLPLGDINVVINTDTHSWVGGHGEKEAFDADYGDVVSFYRLLKEQIEALEESDPEKYKHDIFFVMNGDWIDGTGLAMNGDPSFLIPILEKMPWDAVNVGNHELYRKEVVQYMTRPGGLVESWGEKFLASNIVMTETKEPLGNLYHYLRGKHYDVLVFGFLYNMRRNDPVVTVKKVQETLQESWVEEALVGGNSYDAILVLAHMDHHDPLVHVILDRIRQSVGSDMPVQFVTGHTHYRGQSKPDNTSHSFEAGRYLDTVGFVSFPTQSTVQQVVASSSQVTRAATSTINDADATVPRPDVADMFQHVFIDGKYEALAHALNRETFSTQEGVELSEFIYTVQKDMGLREIVGCAKHDYIVERSMDEEDSLWRLFCNQVVPTIFPRTDGNPIVPLMQDEAWRYDLLEGDLMLDEIVAVSPFNESLYVFRNVPGSVLVRANATLNPPGRTQKVPNWVLCSSPDAEILYDVITDDFSKGSIHSALKRVWPNATTTTTTTLVPPDPVLFPNHTSTSLWLEYFGKSSDDCETDNEDKGARVKEAKPRKQIPAKSHYFRTKMSDVSATVTLDLVKSCVRWLLMLSPQSRWEECVPKRDSTWAMFADA